MGGDPRDADETLPEARPETPPETPRAVTRGTPAPMPTGDPAQAPVDPRVYTVEGEYARGGLGRILLAVDRRLGRTVALKEVLSLGGAADARFVREARITADLQHPGIVPVYEAGRWPTGEPFYAMRLVRGRTLAAVVASTENLTERLALVPSLVAVADALAYAHSRRVIHRDVKPENVLLGAYGETVVIDWGLAKDLDHADPERVAFREPAEDTRQDRSAMTVVGAVVGTPTYMAPEQARGEPLDERADVYALGGLLYFVLSGTAPHPGAGAREVLALRAREPPVPLTARVREVPQDLATIVRKAMAQDPAERYRTAREFSEDLRRFQTGQLVSARQYAWWMLVGRWLKRYRAAVTVATAAAVTLGVMGTVSVRRVVRERNRAEHALHEARARADALVLLQARLTLDRDPTAAMAWLRQYPREGQDPLGRWNVAVEAQGLGVARHVLVWGMPDLDSVAASPTGTLVAAATGREVHLTDVARGVETATVRLDRVIRLAFVPDGSAVIAGDRRGGVFYLPLPAGPPRVLYHQGDAAVLSVTVAPDGQHMASTGPDGIVRVASLPAGSVRMFSGHTGRVRAVAFSPDGTLLASAGSEGLVQVWDVAAGAGRTVGTHPGGAYQVAFSRDGNAVASGGEDGALRWTPVRPGAGSATGGSQLPAVLDRHGQAVSRVLVSPDGRTLAAGDNDAWLSVWDLDTGAHRTLEGHGGRLVSVAYTRDGRALLTTSSDESLRVWDVATGVQLATRVHPSLDGPLLVTGDGRWVTTLGGDGNARVWSTEVPGRTLVGHGDRVFHTVFSPDGALVATDSGDRTVRVWTVATGASVVLDAHGKRPYGLAFSRDGALLAWADEDGGVGLWNRATGVSQRRTDHVGLVREVLFSPDGQTLVSAGDDTTIQVWDRTTGAVRAFRGHAATVTTLSFTPDGQQLASFSQDRTIRLWDMATGRSRVLADHLDEHHDDSYRVTYTPDGQRVASCGGHGTVAVWDLPQGAVHRWTIPGEDPRCSRLAFTPDGHTLGLPGGSVLNLLDLQTGRWRALRGHTAEVHHFHFSADGRYASTASVDRTARVWDVATGAAAVVHRHQGAVFDAVLSPDGRTLATASVDGTAWVGSFDPAVLLPNDPDAVVQRIDAVTSAVIRDGAPVTPAR